MKRAITVLLGIAVLWQLAGAADVPKPGDEILGVWRTTDDKSKVEVFKKRDQYFAKILSLKQPNWPANDEQGMGGKAKTDRKNPSPELRSRAIAGLEFMNDFVYAGKNKWTDGKIYDPERSLRPEADSLTIARRFIAGSNSELHKSRRDG